MPDELEEEELELSPLELDELELEVLEASFPPLETVGVIMIGW